jgi:non-heme chloroperoxidase
LGAVGAREAGHVASAAKLLKRSTLKIYEKFPHGMCTPHADVINADLPAFIKR